MTENYRHELSVYLPLAFVGGFLEIYTYTNMSGLFANAQTSNLVLLFNSLCEKNWFGALYCLIPIILYISAISITEVVPRKIGSVKWPQYCVLIEALCMAAVGFVSPSINGKIAALPIFFLAGLQYNTFRSMQGQGVSTVFCTNNLRQAVIHFWHYKQKNDKAHLTYMGVYIFVIMFFTAGVIVGFTASHKLGIKAVWVCAAIMMPIYLKLKRHGQLFL